MVEVCRVLDRLACEGQMFSEAPIFTVPEGARRDKIPLLEILSLTDLFPSKSEARRTILNGGLSVNGSRFDFDAL